jgi:hypothetical protein
MREMTTIETRPIIKRHSHHARRNERGPQKNFDGICDGLFFLAVSKPLILNVFGSSGRTRTYNPSVNRTFNNVISTTYAERLAA